MTHKEFSSYLANNLKNHYPPREIEGFRRMILEQVVNISYIKMVNNPDTKIPNNLLKRIENIINELKNHKPIQYILGSTEFYGIYLELSHHVLIPRPETEELVHWIIKDTQNPSIRMLDIGTGSGCIALALKKHVTQSIVDATDYSAAILKIAKKNAKKNMLDIHFFEMDILSHPSIDKKYSLIVSNPPYVTESEKKDMQHNILKYEPEEALFVPNNNPMLYYYAIAEFAQKHLHAGGRLYLEINESFPEEVCKLLKQHHFTDIIVKKDIHEKNRMVKAVKG